VRKRSGPQSARYEEIPETVVAEIPETVVAEIPETVVALTGDTGHTAAWIWTRA
jgi:hypothetical protein